MYAKSIRPSVKSATIKSRALGALKLASDEKVPAKQADLFMHYHKIYLSKRYYIFLRKEIK